MQLARGRSEQSDVAKTRGPSEVGTSCLNLRAPYVGAEVPKKEPEHTRGVLFLSGVTRSILHIACNLVRRALGFVHFAFGLHLLVIGELAGLILNRGLRLVDGPLHVFLVHVVSFLIRRATIKLVV